MTSGSGPPAPSSSPDLSEAHGHGGAGGEERRRETEELVRRLEEVTQERDALRASKASEDRVHATLKSRIKRLEQRLVSCVVVARVVAVVG